MYDYESLLDEIMRQRPDITKEELLNMVIQKKSTIGAGYLTDQGALFIIANELGVNLQRARHAELNLKDIQIGLRNVTIRTRILGLYPIKTYTRKDGTKGRYLRFVVFDGERVLNAVAWDDSLNSFSEQQIAVGQTVRIVNCNIRQGIDGNPEISVGTKGKIEILPENEPPLEKYEYQEFAEGRRLVYLKGQALTESKTYSFMRMGEQHLVIQFRARLDDGRECRIVLWDPVEQPAITKGSRFQMFNLRVKKGLNGELEVHGDSATKLTVSKTESRPVRVIKVIAARGTFALVCDREKRIIPVLLSPKTEQIIRNNEIVDIIPEKQTPKYVVCTQESSVRPSRTTFPTKEELLVKLEDAIRGGFRSMFEVVALSYPMRKNIKTKEGTMVVLAELLVGDDSEETKLSAWREASQMFEGINPGERLVVVGAYPVTTKVGERLLQLDNYCVVEKLHY